MEKVKGYFKKIGKSYQTQKRARNILRHQKERQALEQELLVYRKVYGELLSKNLIEEDDIACWLKHIKKDPHCNEAITHHPTIVAERNAILGHKTMTDRLKARM